MYKDIILLTKSKKMGNLCIAGVDRNTGEWVRIISENEAIQHAVRPEDAMYKDGNEPQVLDIVRIKCKEYRPSYHQPENYVMEGSRWARTGTSSIKELLRVHPAEKKKFLFYDTDKCVINSYISQLKKQDIYSLILISPEDICVHVKQFSPNEKKKVTMSFDYGGNRYWYIRITDPEFESTYLQYPDGNYRYQRKCLFVVSLGDVYSQDNKHYKLIAKVIDII